MRRGSVLRRVALISLVVAAASASGCRPDDRLTQAPVAVVLHDDGVQTKVTAVDLSAMKVVRSHRLRSASYSMGGDPSRRLVVTAQAGGVGPDADDAAGVWDLARDRISYVTLPYPNPSSIAVADRMGYVLHGFQVGDALLLSTVDLAAANRVATSTVSEWAHGPETVDGEVFLPVAASRNTKQGYSFSAGSIERLDRAAAEERVVEIARGGMRLCPDPTDERNLILVGTVEDSRTASLPQWRISRIEKATGRILEDRPLDLGYGVMSLCTVRDELFIADANGIEPDDPGRSVVVLDGRTLVERRRIQVTGTPAAVAAWGEQLLVFDGVSSELMVFEAGADRPRSTLKLAGPGRGSGSLVVFGATAAKGE